MSGELANHLWQSTAFAVAAALLTLALRRNQAHVRYWLWFSASVKFLVPFTLLISLGSRIEWAPVAQQMAPPAVSSAVVQISQPFSEGWSSGVPSPAPAPSVSRAWFLLALVALWAGGAAAIVRMRVRVWRDIQSAVRASQPFDMSGLEVPAGLTVRAAPGMREPGVVGFRRPVLLVPAGIEDHLTPRQMQAVVAHELCHVRRRDNMTAAVHMLVEAIFWFHPVVWWLGARLVDERERACDEEVLNEFGEPHVYAEGILNVCRRYVETPLVSVSGVGGANLRRRIEAIMTNHVGLRLNTPKRVALGAAATAAFVLPVLVGAMSKVATTSTLETGPVNSRQADVLRQQESVPRNSARAGDQTAPPFVAAWQSPAGTAARAGTSGTRFEEASIRTCDPENVPPAPKGARGGGPNSFRMTPGRTNALCMTLATLIRTAYGYSPANLEILVGGRGNDMRLDTIYGLGVEDGLRVRGGPNWVRSDRYTIEAIADASADAQTMKGPMLLELLQRRFQLDAHIELEQIPAFALTVAERGLKIKPIEGGCTRPGPPGSGPFVEPLEDVRRIAETIRSGGKADCGVSFAADGPNVVMVGSGARLSGLPLSLQLNASVLDRTGIRDAFNFVLEFGRDERTPGIAGLSLGNEPSNTPRAPDIFTALEEQLGLKLEPASTPREFIVIDRVERPSPN